ncbi:toll-like receptor 13 [Mytilus galloprovincialis]|uniref:Toll-like receptor 13 n=1 Tax=Mytilus galloprovincialis TaxID=29158 RepID=A0A8B6BPS2_MYTGA|nr:toll-like receptor 13 [Mytilus galloprovincialis]
MKCRNCIVFDPCKFDSRCVCFNETSRSFINVSCVGKNITKVPRFPSTVYSIDISNNKIRKIPNGTFENQINLRKLDLTSNCIKILETDSFKGLSNLSELVLEKNCINFYKVPAGVFTPLTSLQHLNCKYTELNSFNLPGRLVSKLRHLEYLEVDVIKSSLDEILFDENFAELVNLTKLKTGFCSVIDFNEETFFNMKYLTAIDLSSCFSQKYDRSLYGRNHLTSLALGEFMPPQTASLLNLIIDVKTFSSLENLVLTGSFKRNVEFNGLILRLFNNLKIGTKIKELRLNNNFIREILPPEATLILPRTLQILDLSYNKLTCLCMDIYNLLILNLQNNLIGNCLPHFYCAQIKNLPLVKYDLSFNVIHKLSNMTFAGHKNLRILNLSNNLLSDIDFDLSYNPKLKILDLSNNNITIISNKQVLTTLTKMMGQSAFIIDLSNNVLSCNCRTVGFLEWIVNNLDHFRNNDVYKCKLDNKTIINMHNFRTIVRQLAKDCNSYSIIVIGVTLGIVVFLITLCVGLMYRYRWKLRYMYYMTKSKYYRNKPDDDNESYTYNAFISYSDMEKDFVFKECIPILEDADEMKLCIHHRDFIPGEEISVNITNAIHESKKTICIITRSFLDSYYCMFEFNMARMESIYSRNEQNILFLVFYEQIQPRKLPLVMLELVQNQSYIEYPHNEEGNVVFWEKVREAIA